MYELPSRARSLNLTAVQLLPIHNELASNTQSRLNLIIGSSIGSATLTYEVIAVFGYLTFGTNVGANIIAMYPASTIFIAVGQLAIVVLVLFSYPLQIQPCRNSLDKVFHPQTAPKDSEEDEIDEHEGPELSTVKHTVLTVGLIASTFTIAYFVNDLQMGLFFSGSLAPTTEVGLVSSIIRRIHRLYHDIFYPTWSVLLEGRCLRFFSSPSRSFLGSSPEEILHIKH